MKLLSVNVAKPKAVDINGRRYRSGIYKRQVSGRLWLGKLGLAGDGQADLEAHGGPHRAVYCYPHEHYDFWARELGRTDFDYGQFGENLTVLGLLESAVRIGDSFRIGGAVIQVSQPRVPCYKLADKLGIPGFEKTFLRANRSGFYARVLEAGALEAGDSIRQLQSDPVGMTVAEVNAARYLDKRSQAAERALQIEALSPEWKRSFAALLGP